MKRYIKASYEEKFWEIHDSGYEAGSKLEDIVDELGLADDIFPDEGEPNATEDAYHKILDIYRGKKSIQEIIPRDVDDVVRDVELCLQNTKGVSRVYYQDEIDAIRFTLSDGYEYQLVLQTVGKL